MEHVKHILAVDNLIEAIEDEIVLGIAHLERAKEFAHHPELAQMFVMCAEDSHAKADKLYKHGHKHADDIKAKGAHEMHHKMACDLWCAEHPDLCADIDELKYMIHMHKGRASTSNPRGY